MIPFRLIYFALHPCDCILTHNNRPHGRIIRMAEKMNLDARDDLTPTHGELIVEFAHNLFGCGMTPRLSLRSLEQLTGKREQIVEVWRPKFLFQQAKIDLQRHLATQLRRNLEKTQYDLWGAILSSPLGSRLFGAFPAFRNDPARNFCTESVSECYRLFGDPYMPVAPNPFELSRYFAASESRYERVPTGLWKGKKDE